MLEFRLQAAASGRIGGICRLKPGLQRLVTEFEEILEEVAGGW
jgi:hypothetical protein